MKNSTPLTKNPVLYLILAQAILWTLAPTLVRHVLPIDANEGFVWGQHFQWGYDRNPWLNALLTHYAVLWGGKTGWLVYAFSQIFVCMAYFSVYQLGKKILTPTAGWIAAFALVGIQYYSIAAVDLNDNVIELGLWPLMVYFGFEAWQTGKYRYWISAGITAGLAMMAKYYSIIPVLCLFTFFIWNKDARAAFKKPGIYLCTAIAFLICLPHLLWLPAHDWITITYAKGKVHMTGYGWMNHFIYAFKFGATQIGAFCGALVLMFCFMSFPCRRESRSRIKSGMTHEKSKMIYNMSIDKNKSIKMPFFNNKNFLYLNAIGPFIITLLISMIGGWKLNTLWGTPLLTLWPLAFMIWFASKDRKWQLVYTPRRAKIFVCTCTAVFALLLAGYTISKIKPGSHSSANIPGRALSQKINQIWASHYHTPLKFVAGNRYPSGYIAFFANHPISVFIDWNPILCGWINKTQFLQHGAVFLEKWNPNKTHFPARIIKAYPHLETYGVISIPYHRAKNGNPKYQVLIGLLPPRL